VRRACGEFFFLHFTSSGGSSAPKQNSSSFCKKLVRSSVCSSLSEKQSLLEKNAQKKSRRFSSETLSFLFRIVVEVN
jgi:hypothetical protein